MLTVLWGADGGSISLAPGWSEIHYVSQTGFKLALIFLPWPLSTKTAHLYRPILDTNLGVQSHTEGKWGERSHGGRALTTPRLSEF